MLIEGEETALREAKSDINRSVLSIAQCMLLQKCSEVALLQDFAVLQPNASQASFTIMLD